jgi:hypothetical protein
MKRTAIFLAVAILFLLASVALADSGGDYDIPWWTVNGGGRLSGGRYILQGAAGQPEAGVLTGGNYTMAGGFWPGAAAEYRIYLPLVLRNV